MLATLGPPFADHLRIPCVTQALTRPSLPFQVATRTTLGPPFAYLPTFSFTPAVPPSPPFQIAMLATLGPPFADHLRGAYLPTIGCSPAFAEEYARMLALGDARQFRDFLRQHMVRS